MNKKEEEVMQIDSKNGVIDLGEFVYHAIKMQDPLLSIVLAAKHTSGESSGRRT